MKKLTPQFLLLLLVADLLLSTNSMHTGVGCDENCQSPRRPRTEEAFNALNHHERSANMEEMQSKLKIIQTRRKYIPWEISSNAQVQKALSSSNNASPTNTTSSKSVSKHPNKKNYPNILFILADDLGYGDLSVNPFTEKDTRGWPCSEGGILTPNLEKMARNGAILTNFHSASPVCSPSRVAILTSLYPWRLGALNAFELGQDLSQRNGFLPQVPTGPKVLRNNGYFTAHSGKWHLGGMREEQRLKRVKDDNCVHPSPNQAGFEHYVSELDGPESGRYTFMLPQRSLHSQVRMGVWGIGG